jgi:hypothetical protein
MAKPPLRTEWTKKVLGYLLDQHGTGGVFGLEIVNAEGIRSGTVYPILARLEKAGWVTSNWEDANVAAQQHRPPRRYYRLTGTGETNARAYCASFHSRSTARQPHASGAPA